ncbi:hypothetical protein ACWKSP_03445 [Micromonosporaceae bacterium Da 78-11]
MSVFRAANNPTMPGRNPALDREPYPLNRVTGEPFPDGPTERIAKGEKEARDAKDARKKETKRNRGVLLAVLVALLALNLAAVAGLLAWRALSGIKAAARPQPPAAAPAGAAPAVAGYSVSYAQEPLRVQVGCSAVMYLDLDEPRTNSGEQASDLRYDSRCGSDLPRLTLGPGAAGGAQVRDSDTDAAGCARAIRTSPIGPGASVEVKKGVVLCVLTAATPAEMTLVEITDVGQTGTAGMRATSWKVTG